MMYSFEWLYFKCQISDISGLDKQFFTVFVFCEEIESLFLADDGISGEMWGKVIKKAEGLLI